MFVLKRFACLILIVLQDLDSLNQSIHNEKTLLLSKEGLFLEICKRP
jgi:hypothetical protein